MATFGFPKDFYKSWAGLPIKILIGGEDDFENRDPKSCNSFIEGGLKNQVQHPDKVLR
jgi:hypothetical protein